MVGAGLPQLLALAGEAKSYSERLFEYPQVDKLNTSAALDALRKPAQQLGVNYTDDAALAIVEKPQGYLLHDRGKHSWDLATTSPITLAVVKTATQLTIVRLDESFFTVPLFHEYLLRTVPANS